MATAAFATGEMIATELEASRTPTTAIAEELESSVPTIETAAHQRTAVRLERNRDVYDGTEAIQAKPKYLPQFEGELDADYHARRTISAVFNGFARTVDAVEGLVCEPEPVLAKDMDPTLIAMAENVDGKGTHLAVFTRRLVRAATVDGFAAILTEMPRVTEKDLRKPGVSLAARVALAEGRDFDTSDAKALELRPYFILVKVDECLPVYETVNGKSTLVMLIRRYTKTERKQRFGRTSTLIHDVYELTSDGTVTFERWADLDGKRELKEGPTVMRNLKAIPWSPLALGKQKGEHEYKPTLDDLAFLTLTHHRIATGILSLEENAFVPTPWRVGAPKDKHGNYPKLVRGMGNVNEIPMPPEGVTLPNPPLGHTSPPVEVLDPAKWSLGNCKAEMGAMGAAFLTPQPVQETATAHRMDATAERANVSVISRDTKDCIESAFGFAGQYINKPAGSITMNNDFVGAGVNQQILAVLVTNYQSDRPIVTLEDVRHYLKTGQLPEGFDPDDTLGLLALTAQNAQDKANARRDALAAIDATDQGDGGAGE